MANVQTSPNPPPNPVDNWMKIPYADGTYYAGPGAGYPTVDGSINGQPLGGDGDGTAGGHTQAEIDDYNDYNAARETYPNLPEFTDIDDFLAHRDEVISNWDDYVREYINEQETEWNTWQRWARKYGKPEDWYPNNFEDWLANPDKAQQQLDIWKSLATDAEREELEEEEYQKKQREYQEYVRQEAFRAHPEYQQPFQQWLDEQAGFSGALEAFAESEYPSLQTRYKAGLPELTGFETREEARAEKARRETGFEAWLPGQIPGLEQEYYMQRPYQRGERYAEQSPTLKYANW